MSLAADVVPAAVLLGLTALILAIDAATRRKHR